MLFRRLIALSPTEKDDKFLNEAINLVHAHVDMWYEDNKDTVNYQPRVKMVTAAYYETLEHQKSDRLIACIGIDRNVDEGFWGKIDYIKNIDNTFANLTILGKAFESQIAVVFVDILRPTQKAYDRKHAEELKRNLDVVADKTGIDPGRIFGVTAMMNEGIIESDSLNQSIPKWLSTPITYSHW